MSNIINRDTIGDMARRAATKYGDKTAIIFRDVKLSFFDLERGQALRPSHEEIRRHERRPCGGICIQLPLLPDQHDRPRQDRCYPGSHQLHAQRRRDRLYRQPFGIEDFHRGRYPVPHHRPVTIRFHVREKWGFISWESLWCQTVISTWRRR